MARALLFSFLVWSSGAVAQIPVLRVSPASLAFVIDGGGRAASQQVRVRNLGSGTLRWTAHAGERWIRLSPASGSGASILSVEIDGATLGPGRHEGRIAVDAPDADDSPAWITVSVEVPAPPVPPVPPSSAPAARAAPLPSGAPDAAPAPAPPADSAVAAEAPSRGPLRIERRVLPPATRNLPYVRAVPVAGGTPPYAMRIVEGRLPAGLVLSQGAVSGTARVQGYYAFVVAVTDASTPPVTIAQPLGLRVIIPQPDTALVVSPLAVTLRLAGRKRDGRAALAIGSGRQRLDWTATADVPWIRLAPSAGVSPAAIEIVALAGQLVPGTHLGTVTVTMEGAPNSPASIPVQVTVPR